MPTTEERLAAIEATLVHMATKEELQELRAEMQGLRAELRAEMQGLRAELIKWMVGTGIGIASVAATLAGILVRFAFTE